jgi:hypothetical protein
LPNTIVVSSTFDNIITSCVFTIFRLIVVGETESKKLNNWVNCWKSINWNRIRNSSRNRLIHGDNII